MVHRRITTLGQVSAGLVFCYPNPLTAKLHILLELKDGAVDDAEIGS